MAVTIQIIVAGALLLAWIWVLGRPLLSGAVGRSDYRNLGSRSYLDHGGVDSEPSGAQTPTRSFRGPRVVGAAADWWNGPVEIRRRQLLLGSMVASFASFLMAIALRDKFLYLFLMMLTVLVVQLIVASQVGGRINEERRSVMVNQAKRRVQSHAEPQGMRIRAPRVRATSFDRVNELVSMLADSEEAKAEPIGVTTYVSELIDQEWGDVERVAAESPASSRVRLEGDDSRTEPEPDLNSDAEQAAAAEVSETVEEAEETEEAEEAEVSTSEPIFTRAVKDAPARARRTAQPIYIESQLDDDEDFTHAKAVNHP